MKTQVRPSRPHGQIPAVPLNAQRGVPGQERLAVYADGYLARVQEALAEVYEAVHRVTGERAFAALSCAYADRHPSQEYNLSRIGRHLPQFLRHDHLTARLPFLPDLALLEWRVAEAFHAYESAPCDPAQMTALPLEAWASARIVFQPSVAAVASAWPILDIWQARAQPRGAIDINLINRPQQVLVCRHGLQMSCRLIPLPAYEMLNALLAGRTLGAACQRLAQRGQGTAAEINTWFGQWMHEGFIVRVERV